MTYVASSGDSTAVAITEDGKNILIPDPHKLELSQSQAQAVVDTATTNHQGINTLEHMGKDTVVDGDIYGIPIEIFKDKDGNPIPELPPHWKQMIVETKEEQLKVIVYDDQLKDGDKTSNGWPTLKAILQNMQLIRAGDRFVQNIQSLDTHPGSDHVVNCKPNIVCLKNIAGIILGSDGVFCRYEGDKNHLDVSMITPLNDAVQNAQATFNPDIPESCDDASLLRTSFIKEGEKLPQKNPEAQYKLGMQYYEGKGVDQSDKKAAKYFKLAAEQGHEDAKFNLKLIYQKMADGGDKNAQYNLGLMYEIGQGVKQSDKKAAKYFKLAAEQGHENAKFNLKSIYQKMADGGDKNAQFNLGFCYEQGYGCEKDLKKAVRLYGLAADQGHSKAQNHLGLMYFKGEGVSQDFTEARTWFEKAAKKGHAEAQNNLGVMYYEGKGVSKNEETLKGECSELGIPIDVLVDETDYIKLQQKLAFYWCEKAAKQGNAAAKDALNRLSFP